MHSNILLTSTVLATLASARTTLLPAETRTHTPSTLEKRYTPPSSSGSYICKDYFDDCGNTYGPGCFTSTPGQPEPTFTTPVCNFVVTTVVVDGVTETLTVSKSGPTVTPAAVMQRDVTTIVVDGVTETLTEPSVVCKDYFDECGNTYGPGCYTSFAGQGEPSFTTPVCEAKPTAS